MDAEGLKGTTWVSGSSGGFDGGYRLEFAADGKFTYTLPGDDAPTNTVTDAEGVTELVRQASAVGARAHIRPLPEAEPPTPD